MAVLAAQVSLKSKTGQSKDTVVNTFHFATQGVAPLAPELDAIAPLLHDFYTAGNASGNSVGGWFANTVAQAGHSIKVYDLTEPKPRIPLREVALDLGFNPSTIGLPAEVAVCLSFHSAFVSGVSKARHRGRIFFGPIRSTGTLQTDAAGNVRPSDALKTSLLQAGARLMADSGTNLVPWCTYSRVGTTGAVLVTGGWVDDAFDTQRRRGAAPVVKTTFGA